MDRTGQADRAAPVERTGQADRTGQAEAPGHAPPVLLPAPPAVHALRAARARAPVPLPAAPDAP